MNEAELQQELNALTEQVQKIGTETDALKAQIDVLNQKVADLEAELAKQEITPETQAAFDALKAQVAVVDSKVDDIPVVGRKAKT